ncbi:MAG: hypothetical protein R3F02_21130 [Thiolinea sp.]
MTQGDVVATFRNIRDIRDMQCNVIILRIGCIAVTLTDRSLDAAVYPLIGKRGFGDIDLSTDGSTLYVANLFDSKLYTVNTSGTPGDNEVANAPWLDNAICPANGNVAHLQVPHVLGRQNITKAVSMSEWCVTPAAATVVTPVVRVMI